MKRCTPQRFLLFVLTAWLLSWPFGWASSQTVGSAKIDNAEWQAFLKWCTDLLWKKNIESVDDPLGLIRYKVGPHLMTAEGFRSQKLHCETVVHKDWCRRVPDGLGCAGSK